MKRVLAAALVFGLILTGCGSSSASKEIDTLNLTFVPTVPAEDVLAASAPLEDMLKEEMANYGYTIGSVNMTVGTSLEAVGESMTAGTTDVALIPGGTYVLYEDDGVELALTATRNGLNVDSDNAADWNLAPTEQTDEQVTYYRSLMVAGPSEIGQKLQDKVNNGEELTFDDINEATWCVQSPSSSAGYLYPTMWLSENFDGKTFNDLDNVTELTGIGEAIGRLSSEQCDVAPVYANARIDNTKLWTRDEDIFDATGVIGVTDPIFNDTISVSQNSDVYSDDFVEAIQNSFIDIASTPEGLATVAPYSHTGYEIGDPANYDDERTVQEEVIANL